VSPKQSKTVVEYPFTVSTIEAFMMAEIHIFFIETIHFATLGLQKKLVATINRMTRKHLPRIIKICRPKGRTNQGRPLKRLVDV